MTAALEADPRIGSTLPRLFTPPLPPHVDDDAEYGINPAATWGPLCCDFLERLLGWHLLPWQKWLYYRALEKRADGTGFRFRTLIVLVGRQQGKTTWGRGLGLWRLFMSKDGKADPTWPAAKLAVVAAQNLEYAETTLKEIVDEIRDQPLLAHELINHRLVNGGHRAILTYRRNWKAATANRKGGRSLPVDFAWLDEIREHTTFDAWNAIEPTTTVRPCSQLLATSNAGDVRSVVLRSLRDTQIRELLVGDTTDTKTGFFEWSVPDDVDPRDENYWHMAQPALGLLNDFTLEDLLGKFRNMQAENMAGWQTEYLCQWVDSLKAGIIPAQAWADTVDEQSRRADGADVYVCVDTNYHRTRTWAAMAALRGDGAVHTEVMHSTKTIEEMLAWLLGTNEAGVVRHTAFKGICAQKTGAPISGSLDDFRAAGIDVTEWGAPIAQLSGGAGEYYDGLTGHTIRHRRHKPLDVAAKSTVARTVSSDAWFFDRRRSPVDASPVIASCGAVWLLNNPPEHTGPPTVHEWPSDDIIEQWRKEADERFNT